MYTSDPRSKVPVKESFAPLPSRTPQTRIEPGMRVWIGQFWKTCHVMARSYNPGNGSGDMVRKSYACFFEAMGKLLPSEQMRRMMGDFIMMTPEIQKTLLDSPELASFRLVHEDVTTRLKSNPRDFFNSSLADSDSLFAWTYLFHAYYNLLNRIPVEIYNNVKAQYDKSQISKETWGNPIWAMIHFTAFYCHSTPDQEWRKSFTAFISCLRFCLPCPLCRANLEKNLSQLDINNYIFTREGCFDYTHKLHNMVNAETDKPQITLEEARRIYAPFDEPLVRQNSSFRS